ncbi:MAG: AAA family ATPase [Gemmatimonadaceae bacterium]
MASSRLPIDSGRRSQAGREGPSQAAKSWRGGAAPRSCSACAICLTIWRQGRIRAMPHLRSVTLRESRSDGGFPFSVPVVRALEPFELSPTVTFLVGENGSGKSTLLEGIALAAKLPTVGSRETRASAAASFSARRTFSASPNRCR